MTAHDGPQHNTTARFAGRGTHVRQLIALALVALACRLATTLVLYPAIQARTGLARGSDGYVCIAATFAAGGGYRFAPDLAETSIGPRRGTQTRF